MLKEGGEMLNPRKFRRLAGPPIAFALIAGVIVLAPGAAVAKQPVPPTAALDTATASGDGGVFTNIHINASSGPTGENPSGTGSFVAFGIFNIGGPVTCLNVTGNTAVLNINDQTFGFGILTVTLTDNGGNGRDEMNAAPSGRAPTDCSPFSGTQDTLSSGRATVFDAPPLPTSKEQCKNDGWAQYGFANQGQCIKFVNHA
jgi:hypothetical protein